MNRPTTIARADVDTPRTRAQPGLEARISSYVVWSRRGEFVRVIRRYYSPRTRKDLINLLTDWANAA